MRMFARISVAVTMLAASTAMAGAQDLAMGETSFKKCATCHAVGEGAKNKVGPVLNGLDGRKSGTIEGYSYSAANKNSGIVWNEATFKAYIRDPKAAIPNTKDGVGRDQEREGSRRPVGVSQSVRGRRQEEVSRSHSRPVPPQIGCSNLNFIDNVGTWPEIAHWVAACRRD
jgi:cytochrome c